MRVRIATALVMTAVWLTPIAPPRPPEPISVARAVSLSDWTALRQPLTAQAEWYATAASPPVLVSLPPGRGPLITTACGGTLPSCAVMTCESHGDLTAQNPRSSASGKWQILDSTWAGYGGYSRAMYAPEDVQDAKARELYAGGRGRSQWAC